MRTGFVLEVGFNTPIQEAPKLYFDDGRGFNEEDSVTGVIKSGGRSALFRLPRQESREYRLDPPAQPELQSIAQPILYSDDRRRLGAINLAGARSSVQTEIVSADAEGLAYKIAAEANDPQLLLPPATVEAQVSRGAEPARLAVRLLLVLLLAGAISCSVDRLLRPSTTLNGVVVMGLVVALTVAFAFAISTSTERAHNPDERNHAAAAQYYVENALPPAVTDSAVTPTLSGYGMSYLNELDVVYWMAGRVMHYVSSDRFVDLSSFRIFNVGLLGLLVLMAWLVPRHSVPLAVLLLTPQVWYVYAYFNADALPITAGLLAVILVSPHSRVARFIDEGGRPFWSVLALALVLAVLLLSKRNFLPLLPLVALWLMVRHLRMGALWAATATVAVALAIIGVFFRRVPHISESNGDVLFLAVGAFLLAIAGFLIMQKVFLDRTLRRPFARMMTIFALALLMALPRIAYDISVNGSPVEKSDAIMMLAEAHAVDGFKPSHWLAKNNATGMNLAHQGVGLAEIAGSRNWLETSIDSAFGKYGYMDVTQPVWMYLLLQGSFVLFCTGVLYRLVRSSPSGAAFAVLGVGFSFIIALNSLLHSWTGDFQPQGRYLLPILIAIAAMLTQVRPEAKDGLRWVKPVLVVAAIICAYSILTVAMPGVGFAGNS